MNVQIGRASSLADVTNAMNRNSSATNGKADAYVFVTGVACAPTEARTIGDEIDAFGQASGWDLRRRKKFSRRNGGCLRRWFCRI